jgi:archaellum component FlaF (FlaF/FlaG flagellin family)
MRGISTILAVILIVIIVVAMISLTYTFAVNLFTTTTTGAEEQTSATTERMLKGVTFASASCDAGNNIIRFTIRHTGSVDIESGELAAFIDGSKADFENSAGSLITAVPLDSGQVSDEFNYTSTTDYQDGDKVKITVSAPAGEVERTVTCE